jgi:superfamily II DNA/RNA helicase
MSNFSSYLVLPKKEEKLLIDVIFQVCIDVTKAEGGKLQVLKAIDDTFTTMQPSIIFAKLTEDIQKIASMLQTSQRNFSILHREMIQAERDRVIHDFQTDRSKVLITNLELTRLDIPAIAMVINYDLPLMITGSQMTGDAGAYLNRIGRCVRLNHHRGIAINLLEHPNDSMYMESIERYFVPSGRMTTDCHPNDIGGLMSKMESFFSSTSSDAEEEVVISVFDTS